MTKSDTATLLAVASSGALLGGSAVWLYGKWLKKSKDPEVDPSVSKSILEKAMYGAMQSSGLYIGDKLNLYKSLADVCSGSSSASVTAVELADITGFHQRWLREWLAQQAAMGILLLLPGDDDTDEDLRYRIPSATAKVMADSSSTDYAISMIQVVPSLVYRAKTMMPEAFRTGMGIPYNETDVSEGIDRHHAVHIRDVFLAQVVPKAKNGRVLKMLQEGDCKVADLGCGGAGLIIAMAREFPKASFHGYDVSREALEIARLRIKESNLSNVFVHDANIEPLGSQKESFDLVTTFDVLHDVPNPRDLIGQVRKALVPGGVWLLADVPSAPTVRENIQNGAFAAASYWSFSLCLCMACATCIKDGEGLGTLGFSVPVAKEMLSQGGFTNIKVLLEHPKARWFVAT